jgi:hypothetical protein
LTFRKDHPTCTFDEMGEHLVSSFEHKLISADRANLRIIKLRPRERLQDLVTRIRSLLRRVYLFYGDEEIANQTFETFLRALTGDLNAEVEYKNPLDLPATLNIATVLESQGFTRNSSTALAVITHRPGIAHKAGPMVKGQTKRPSAKKMPSYGKPNQASHASFPASKPSGQKLPPRLKDPSKVCNSCHKRGHVSDDCFQKHPEKAPPAIRAKIMESKSKGRGGR